MVFYLYLVIGKHIIHIIRNKNTREILFAKVAKIIIIIILSPLHVLLMRGEVQKNTNLFLH